jgi:hypothetical protein
MVFNQRFISKIIFVLLSGFVSSVYPQSITVTSPNGGEVWITEAYPAYASKTITWDYSDTIDRVNIELYRNQSWETLRYNAENEGRWTWSEVEGPASESCMVKVVDFNNPEVFDISDSVFTIVRQIRFGTPSGSEIKYPGENLLIHWITSGLGGDVKIEYSITGGPSWISLISSMPDTGWFTWDSIPDAPTTGAKVKVSHLTYTEDYDVSSGFTILRHIWVTSPKAGDTLYTNTSYNIKWSTSGIGGMVKIDYYDDSSWDTVTSSTPDDGSFSWVVPNILTDNAKIRIVYLSYPNNVATSDTFVIAEGTTITGLPYCYPNPFSLTGDTKTTIKYMIENDARVTIKIYDVESNLVKTLIEDVPELAGVYYAQDWDGQNAEGKQIANGVYFFVVTTDRGENQWLKIAVLE